MNKDSELVINIMTGVVTFRNETNDEHVTTYPISRKHAIMIEQGKLKSSVVCAAIKAKMMANEKFDFDEYTKGLAALNVRKSALNAEIPRKELFDRSSEAVDDKEIEAAEIRENLAEGLAAKEAAEEPKNEAPVKPVRKNRKVAVTDDELDIEVS